MAKFSSERYPGLILQDDKGIWAKFEGGEFETTDATVIKRLRALPESEGITEVKTPAKAEGDGSGDSK